MTQQRQPAYDAIERASRRLHGVAHRTPVLTSATLNQLSGAEIYFKCENFQRMGAFKFRGGFNAISSLSPEQRQRGIVTFSSGNHAQAVALAAKLHGISATVVMPSNAPAAKKPQRWPMGLPSSSTTGKLKIAKKSRPHWLQSKASV